jgi:hypothetical protein
MRDTDPAAVALDYGLPQRALIAVSGRADDVAELITRRLTISPQAASRPSMGPRCERLNATLTPCPGTKGHLSPPGRAQLSGSPTLTRHAFRSNR